MILDKVKNAKYGFFWGVISKIIALILPFVIRSLLIYKMGSEYAGLGNLFSAILQVLSLAELGFGSAMVYSMYKPIANNDEKTISALLNYYKKVYFIIGLIVLLLGLIVLPFVNFLIQGEIPNDINIYLLFGIYLFNTVSSYFVFGYRGALLSAYQREDINSIITLIVNVFLYVTQIIVLLLYPNYYVYIIILPISTILFNIMKFLLVKKKYPTIKPIGEIDTDTKSDIKKKINALLFHKIGGVVVNSADNIVISAFLGLVVLSNYNNYYYIISAISALVLILFTSLCAGVANSLIVKTKEENEKFFYKVFFINCIIVSFCTICLFNMLQPFIELWVGKDKMFPLGTLVLFCIYFYIHMIRRTIIMYRDAFGAWIDNKWQPIVSCIFNLIINIILVNIIGLNGIIISTILSMLLIDIPWETISFFRNTSKYNYRKYIFYMIYFIIITSGLCYGCSFISFVDNLYLEILLQLVLSFGALIIIICSCFWMEEFKSIIKKYFKDRFI